ncbi:MAG: sigma-70 family RNA polymerase sigma factor [Planctomycetes bacterium]|nr:sigma-70 family RNA polymerase sigma factor [Planctomycetota bacterium]
MTPTDATLLEQWTRGRDAEAFREIVDRYARMAYATARRILGDPARAEDIAQDCFLKLVETRAMPSSLPAWLHRVATNLSLNAVRARKRRRDREARWRPPQRAPQGPAWEEVEALVDEAIEGLPDEWRQPIVLHFLGGRTHEAVASAMGISKAAAAHRIERGIEKIRSVLRRRGIGVAPALLAGWLSTRTAEAAPASLCATLGKMALAGPKAAALSATLVVGGLMKLSISIAAAVLIAGACLFFVTRSRDGRGIDPAGPEVASGRPAAGEAEQPAPVSPAVVPPADPRESGSAPEPAPEEEKEEPLASIAGIVVDEKGSAIPRAQVLAAFHPKDSETSDLWGQLRDSWFRRSHVIFAEADDRGAFLFEEVPFSGEATVSAFAQGFACDTTDVQIDAGKPREGVVLKLSEGKTLRGILTGTDGRPAADAIISIYHAWSAEDMAWGSGVGTTDARGSFAIGIPIRAEFCTLRVNSDTYGQDFFLRVPVSDQEVHLRMKERAVLRGRITWEDGSPAAGCFVGLTTEVPEPDVLTRYSGLRRRLGGDTAVDGDGRYEIWNLQPGFTYRAEVVRAEQEEGREGRRQALAETEVFTFAPGEVKTWDVTLTSPIIVRGTVRTERLKTPIPRARIGLRKDGEEVGGSATRADEKGSYRFNINTGPGRYLVYAKPEFIEWDEAGDAIAERFGRTIDVRGGEDVLLDLEVFEPIVIPIRVLDADGRPVESIQSELSFQTLSGRRYGCGGSRRLSADGRTSFALHIPVREMRIQVGAFPSGPKTEERRFQPAVDTTLPEQVFVLERTCDLEAAVVDAAGQPLAERRFDVRVTYADKRKESFGIHTDPEGRFELKGRLRAMVFTIRLDGDDGVWTSEHLDGSAGFLDLGAVVPEPSRDKKKRS